MNINDLVSASAARRYLGFNSGVQSSSSAGSSQSAGLQKAEIRIQSQVDKTNAQLSSFGQLKSNVSNVQLSAQAMAGLNEKSSNNAVKAAANSFVSSFNATVTSAKTTASVTTGTAASSSATRVGKDMVRAVSDSKATIDSLKNIGFSMQKDGSLTVDAKKFEAAQLADPAGVKAALAKIGQQVDKTATQELATSGDVNASVASLSQRATVLKNQQTALAGLQQTASASTTGTSSYYGSSLLAAYGG